MLHVNNVSKQYGKQAAVDDISFEIEEGKIFGLLGPNGAGKSSLLRMITGITQPDSGEIKLNNCKFDYNLHNPIIGYMPEEKGLYKKMKVAEQVEYLGRLKGMSKRDAQTEMAMWFKKLDIETWRNKKVQDLSKGMSQKVQFVTTVLHRPKLLILDEPFSGLDPVNADIIKQEIFAIANEGATIIFSTHRMEQVEEICHDIVLMNKGKNILEGKVASIKQSFKQGKYQLVLDKEIDMHSALFDAHQSKDGHYVLQLNSNAQPNDVLTHCIAKQAQVQRFNELLPSLNDIFIQLVDGKSTTQFTQ